jgi:enoyl-CoA hydratase/carnithine racemase
MRGKTVLYRREDNIGIITLNRPHRLNAINADLLKDFKEKINIAREDKETVSVILERAGRTFCSGEDLKETSAGKGWGSSLRLTFV